MIVTTRRIPSCSFFPTNTNGWCVVILLSEIPRRKLRLGSYRKVVGFVLGSVAMIDHPSMFLLPVIQFAGASFTPRKTMLGPKLEIIGFVLGLLAITFTTYRILVCSSKSRVSLCREI